MSGGYFEHKQHNINSIINDLESYLSNDTNRYSGETLNKFYITIDYLKTVNDMAHHVDWLLSGDYDEEDFHKKWKEDLLPNY
jgi:hypothetical protein